MPDPYAMTTQDAAQPAIMTDEPVDASAQAEADHQKLVAAVNECVRKAEDVNREHVMEYAQIRRLYRCIPDTMDVRGGRAEPGRTRARIANNELFRCIESVTSAEDAVLWGDDPNVQLWDPDLDDQATAVMYHTQQLIDRGHEEMDLRTECMNAMRSCNLYGRVTVEYGWEERDVYTQQPVIDPNTGEPTGETTFGPQREYARPFMRTLSPWNVYMDGDSVKTSTWVAVKRRWASRAELEAWIDNAKAYGMTTRDLDPDEATAQTGETPGEVARNVERRMQREIGIRPDERGGYEGIDYWGLHPSAKDPNDPEGKRRDPRCWRIVVVNGAKAIIEGLNQYNHGRIPFLDCRMIPEEGSAEGRGAGQILKYAQMVVNATESLMQEMLNFALYGVWQRMGGLTSFMGQTLRVFPGRILDENREGVFKRMEQDVAPFKIAQGMLAMRIEGMRAASGATTNTQGMITGGTATEVRTIAAEAARRLASMAVTFGNQILRPFVAMELKLYDQFMPADEPIVTQVPFQGRMVSVRATKADLRLGTTKVRLKIATDLDFRKNMTRNLNQAMQQQGALLASLMQAAPGASPQIVEGLMPGIVELQKKQLSINGMNPSMVPPDLIAQITQSMAMAQQAQMQIEAAKAAQPAQEPAGVA